MFLTVTFPAVFFIQVLNPAEVAFANQTPKAHTESMKKPQVHAIAAIGKNAAGRWVLGRGNELIWRIPEDLERFKTLTVGHPIIMGRKTFESIGRPLPDRTSIVITRDLSWKNEGVRVVNSAQEAIAYASSIDKERICIIGGGEIYVQMLPYTDVLNLTIIDAVEEGDVFFPIFETLFTNEIFKEERVTHGGLKYSWIDLTRRT